MRRRQIFAAQNIASNAVTHFEKESRNEEVQRQEATEEVLKVKPCPTCGKVLARGWYAHQKYCKG